jgi:hypothetical protein
VIERFFNAAGFGAVNFTALVFTAAFSCQERRQHQDPPPAATVYVSACPSSPEAPSAAVAAAAAASPLPSAAASAATSSAPSASGAGGWKPVTDLDQLVGTWIDAEHGDSHADGKLHELGVRVVVKRNKKSKKTPYSLTFWAPKPGHLGSKTVSGGCGFYGPPKGLGGNTAVLTAYCAGYGRAEEGVKTELRIGTDGSRTRFVADGWFETTAVRR